MAVFSYTILGIVSVCEVLGKVGIMAQVKRIRIEDIVDYFEGIGRPHAPSD